MFQHSMCDRPSLRACLDELKEQADSNHDNYNADVFIQLRHYLAKHDPEFLTADDHEFQSPASGVGKTFTELQQQLIDTEFQEYFGKYEIGNERDDEMSDHDEISYRTEENEKTQQHPSEFYQDKQHNEEWEKLVQNTARRVKTRP